MFTKQERQIFVQNNISNFQPQQHQNRKLASRHFAAKLDPKQKVSFVQRKMFCFCLKKKGCNWQVFPPPRLPQSSVFNFLFQMPTAGLKLNANVDYCKCNSNSGDPPQSYFYLLSFQCFLKKITVFSSLHFYQRFQK